MSLCISCAFERIVMSLPELIVVLIVTFLVAKPGDFPKILSRFKEIRAFIANTKKEIMSHLDFTSELEQSLKSDISSNLNEEVDQVNFYLEKIANLGVEYESEYSLSSVKEHYRKIVKDKVKQEVKDRS